MVLRTGSRGIQVKDLQEFLNIGADGIFGEGTAKAVKAWQSRNGLKVDGIVGPRTWDTMGLATTDISEQVYTLENGLLLEQYYLPEGEYKTGPTKKEYIFLHHTAGWHNPFNTVDNWGRDNRGAVCTEFVLGGPSIKGDNDTYDGKLLQAFPEGGYGWHLGKNGSQHMHTHSVGLEVNNFGYIVNGKAYQGTPVDKSQIVTLKEPFRGHKTWHRYSDKQIEAIRLWLLWIAERDNIDIRKGLPEWVKEKGAAGFEFNSDAYYGKVKGVLTHTNTRKDKFDMFPQQELLDMLTSL
jgi:hypothetical protein